MQTEPHIVINGQILTEAQAMTVRVAVQTFALDLTADGLGTDALGRSIAAGYQRAISQINTIMLGAVEAPAPKDWTASDHSLADQCRAIADCGCRGEQICGHCFNAGVRLDG